MIATSRAFGPGRFGDNTRAAVFAFKLLTTHQVLVHTSQKELFASLADDGTQVLADLVGLAANTTMLLNLVSV